MTRCGKRLYKKIPIHLGMPSINSVGRSSSYSQSRAVIANGFDDLRQRVDGQTEQATAHKGNIKVSMRAKFSSYFPPYDPP